MFLCEILLPQLATILVISRIFALPSSVSSSLFVFSSSLSISFSSLGLKKRISDQNTNTHSLSLFLSLSLALPLPSLPHIQTFRKFAKKRQYNYSKLKETVNFVPQTVHNLGDLISDTRVPGVGAHRVHVRSGHEKENRQMHEHMYVHLI